MKDWRSSPRGKARRLINGDKRRKPSLHLSSGDDYFTRKIDRVHNMRTQASPTSPTTRTALVASNDDTFSRVTREPKRSVESLSTKEEERQPSCSLEPFDGIDTREETPSKLTCTGVSPTTVDGKPEGDAGDFTDSGNGAIHEGHGESSKPGISSSFFTRNTLFHLIGIGRGKASVNEDTDGESETKPTMVSCMTPESTITVENDTGTESSAILDGFPGDAKSAVASTELTPDASKCVGFRGFFQEPCRDRGSAEDTATIDGSRSHFDFRCSPVQHDRMNELFTAAGCSGVTDLIEPEGQEHSHPSEDPSPTEYDLDSNGKSSEKARIEADRTLVDPNAPPFPAIEKHTETPMTSNDAPYFFGVLDFFLEKYREAREREFRVTEVGAVEGDHRQECDHPSVVTQEAVAQRDKNEIDESQEPPSLLSRFANEVTESLGKATESMKVAGSSLNYLLSMKAHAVAPAMVSMPRLSCEWACQDKSPDTPCDDDVEDETAKGSDSHPYSGTQGGCAKKVNNSPSNKAGRSKKMALATSNLERVKKELRNYSAEELRRMFYSATGPRQPQSSSYAAQQRRTKPTGAREEEDSTTPRRIPRSQRNESKAPPPQLDDCPPPHAADMVAPEKRARTYYERLLADQDGTGRVLLSFSAESQASHDQHDGVSDSGSEKSQSESVCENEIEHPRRRPFVWWARRRRKRERIVESRSAEVYDPLVGGSIDGSHSKAESVESIDETSFDSKTSDQTEELDSIGMYSSSSYESDEGIMDWF